MRFNLCIGPRWSSLKMYSMRSRFWGFSSQSWSPVSFNYVLYCVVWVLMFDHLCFGQHHCRNCGDIFCDKCTRGRIALTSDEDALQVRVCDRCMVCVVLVHFPLHPLPIPSTDAWFMLPLQFLRFSASWWKFQFMFFCPSWMGLLSPVSLHFSIALV